MIPVTKPYLPCRKKLEEYIDGIYERQWLTNNGPLVQQLTRRLEAYLGVENLLLVANGTLALQIAYRALGVSGVSESPPAEAITTPFTFIATASSMKWDGVQPVFSDIDPNTWCLDSTKLEQAVAPNTRAIVPVHVFGNACKVDAIDSVAKKHGLKVIYDACHAFGSSYNGRSLLKYGDAATLSFHATKLFHTGEGGAVIFKEKADLERAKLLINFGIDSPNNVIEPGINAKMSELHAAMGLCVLDEMEANLRARLAIWRTYERELRGSVQMQKLSEGLTHNAAYFATVFDSEKDALKKEKLLKQNGVMPRRYFYPSLQTLNFFENNYSLPVSTSIAKRILCLPIYPGLKPDEQKLVVDIIKG